MKDDTGSSQMVYYPEAWMMIIPLKPISDKCSVIGFANDM